MISGRMQVIRALFCRLSCVVIAKFARLLFGVSLGDRMYISFKFVTKRFVDLLIVVCWKEVLRGEEERLVIFSSRKKQSVVG